MIKKKRKKREIYRFMSLIYTNFLEYYVLKQSGGKNWDIQIFTNSKFRMGCTHHCLSLAYYLYWDDKFWMMNQPALLIFLIYIMLFYFKNRFKGIKKLYFFTGIPHNYMLKRVTACPKCIVYDAQTCFVV